MKKPSPATELKRAKAELREARERQTYARACDEIQRLRADVSEWERRYADCDNERLRLVDALCMAVKPVATPVADQTPRPTKVCRWQVGEKKIQAIKAVREVTYLGLADAKGLVESGAGNLTQACINALKPWCVSFEVLS